MRGLNLHLHESGDCHWVLAGCHHLSMRSLKFVLFSAWAPGEMEEKGGGDVRTVVERVQWTQRGNSNRGSREVGGQENQNNVIRISKR